MDCTSRLSDCISMVADQVELIDRLETNIIDNIDKMKFGTFNYGTLINMWLANNCYCNKTNKETNLDF